MLPTDDESLITKEGSQEVFAWLTGVGYTCFVVSEAEQFWAAPCSPALPCSGADTLVSTSLGTAEVFSSWTNWILRGFLVSSVCCGGGGGGDCECSNELCSNILTGSGCTGAGRMQHGIITFTGDEVSLWVLWVMDEVFSGVGDKQVEEEVCWMQAGSLSCWRGSPNSPDSNLISEQYPRMMWQPTQVHN